MTTASLFYSHVRRRFDPKIDSTQKIDPFSRRGDHAKQNAIGREAT